MIVNKYTKGNGGGGSGSTYSAGEYISIENDVISVTGITPDLYLTTADTQDFATEAYVDAAITSATQDFATEVYVDATITSATQDFVTEADVDAAITSATQDFVTEADITAATSPIQEHLSDVERVTATAITELHDAVLEVSGSTYTKAETDAAITGATQGFATEAYVTAATENLMTSADTQWMIEEATSGITEDLDEVIDMMQTKEQIISIALNDLEDNKVESQDIRHMVKLTQAQYDLIASPDPETFYIIVNNQ